MKIRLAAWLGALRRQHSRRLAAPMPFLLTGDGPRTRRLIRQWQRRELIAGVRAEEIGGKLAEARYRDWLAAQRQRGRSPKRQ